MAVSLNTNCPRVRRATLLYPDVAGPLAEPSRARAVAGILLIIVGVGGGMVAGNLLSSGGLTLFAGDSPTRSLDVGVGVLPFLALVLLGLALL